MTYCDITERQVLKKVVSMKFNQKVRDFNVVLNGEFYFSLNGEDLEMVDENSIQQYADYIITEVEASVIVDDEGEHKELSTCGILNIEAPKD